MRSEWLAVLEHYDLGPLLALEAGGGTASPKVWVTTEGGRYLLRRRRAESSLDAVVRFDHGVIQALAEAGLPTVPPVRTRTGASWVQLGAFAYECFPFVPDLEPFRPGDVGQLTSAARTLAQLHVVTGPLSPPGRKDWEPEHQIGATLDTLRATLAEPLGTVEERDAAAEMLRSGERLAARLTPAVLASLPTAIIHGDYTPANVLFRGQEVGGIFDFDWVSRQPRLIDVGEAILFFAFRRAAPINPDSIWSLVQSWEPDADAARAFLEAYEAVAPLTGAERAALPLLMWQTWLGVRVRAMRKVEPAARLRLLTEGMLASLQWMEQAKL